MSHDIFKQYYVQPSLELLKFPDKKRNIIFIQLESFESYFLHKKVGGFIENYELVNLGNLATDTKNVHFSHKKEGVGGAIQLHRTRPTCAATYAMMCGLPNKYYNNDVFYYPKTKCISDILHEANYTTTAIYGALYNDFMMGDLFKLHGVETLITSTEINNERYAKDFEVFEHLKKHINISYASGKPFYVQALTLDTHDPGFPCKYCPSDGKDNQEKTMRCLDRQIGELMEYFKKQPWYDDTLIVLHGDHNYRDINIQLDLYKGGLVAGIYNVFINSALQTQFNKNRLYSSMDVFPTILSAAGITIAGNKLGLGTNLFSGHQTIIELKGKSTVNKNMEFFDTWYDSYFLKKGSSECKFNEPCLDINSTFYEKSSYLNSTGFVKYYPPPVKVYVKKPKKKH